MPRLLYHFTAREYLPAIMREGLRLGDVPTRSITNAGENAVWLTVDPHPNEHGLGSPRELTDDDRQFVHQWSGVLPPKGARWADKSAVRITIGEVPEPSDLVRWCHWGRQHVASDIYDRLTRAGGAKHRSWFLYWGIIPPDCFAAVEFRDAEGRYAPNAPSLAQLRGLTADAA